MAIEILSYDTQATHLLCAVEIKERAVLDGAVDACQAAATRFSDSPSVA